MLRRIKSTSSNSGPLLHSVHKHLGPQNLSTAKQSQYNFKHFDFLHLHLGCSPPSALLFDPPPDDAAKIAPEISSIDGLANDGRIFLLAFAEAEGTMGTEEDNDARRRLG